MIIGCIPVYNEEDFIRRSVGSLQGVCDRIIVVDGAYSDFPLINDAHHSTDDTLRIAREMGAEVIFAEKPWPDQVAKRNELLRGRDGDYYIFLDADEKFEGVFYPDIDSEQAYLVQCWNYKNNRVSQDILRIFRHDQGIEFRG